MNFDQLTIERLKYYVYALENGAKNKIFYIGKGKGNRVFDHQKGRLLQKDMYIGEDLSKKNEEIDRILEQGHMVKAYIIRWGLKETEALTLESALIDFLKLNKKINLTNKVRGSQTEYGITTAEEIINRYNATPLLESDINDNIMLININKEYFNCLESGYINYNILYEKTRKAWLVNPRRANQAKYICTVYRGVVKATFEKEGDWVLSSSEVVEKKDGSSKRINRYAFSGVRFENSPYDNKDVSDYYKKGSQGAIKYTYR